MWRYYELLTDLSIGEIERMKIACMDLREAKRDLAFRIVTDFHSTADAERVASSWGQLPPVETLEHHQVADARLNRTLVQAKFAPSVTEADKLVKTPNTVAVTSVSTGEERVAIGSRPSTRAGRLRCARRKEVQARYDLALVVLDCSIFWICTITNSAGCSGAKPISTMSRPFSMSVSVMVVRSQRAKNASFAVEP